MDLLLFQSAESSGHEHLGEAEEDATWAGREDWDIAICGDYLKTNSGTSGHYTDGGIQQNTISDFYGLTDAPATGYQPDIDGIVIK